MRRCWAYNRFGVLMGASWQASCSRWLSLRGNSWPMITLFSSQGRFCATAKNGNTLSLYLNGVFDSAVALTAASVSNAGPLYIGQDPWGPGIVGDIDDIRIYDCALAAAEVASLYT